MPVKSHLLGPGTLTIGKATAAREFAAEVTKCAIEPNVKADDNIPVLSGEEAAGDITESYNLTFTFLQAYDKDDAVDWSYANKFAELPFVWTPLTDGTRSWSGVVRVMPVTIGGDVKKRNTSDAEWPMIGSPTPIDTVDVLNRAIPVN